jgi:hypothetical protein
MEQLFSGLPYRCGDRWAGKKINTPGHVARFGGYEPVFVFRAWSGGRRGEASYSLSILCRARDFPCGIGGFAFFFWRRCRMMRAKRNEGVFSGRDEVLVIWRFIEMFLK